MLQKHQQDLNGLDIMVATDNQATLHLYNARKPTPGSYLIEDAKNLIERIEEKWPRARLKLQWVPGHKGIEGNEKADMEAKRAVEGKHRNRRHEHHRLLKNLPASKPASKQYLKKKLWKEYEKRVSQIIKIWKVGQIQPQNTSIQLHEDHNETFQVPSKYSNSTTH